MIAALEVLESIHRLDVRAFQRIMSSSRHRTLASVALYVSRTGDGWLYPFVPLLVYGLGFPEPLTFFTTLMSAFILERIVYFFAKNGFKRKRPQNILTDFTSLVVPSDEFSFPSGHTSASFLVVTMLTVFYGPAFAVLYLWSFFVGCSRVILGVHFPTDICMGALVGSSIAYFTCLNALTLL